MIEACAICRQRKPNRFCPGLRAGLCSICCGQSRHKIVQCPEDCPFLIESRRQGLKRLVRLDGDPELELRWFEVLHNLRLALVKVRERTQPALSDEEAREALANIIESLRVRAKGLIYDFRSPNPNIQEAVDALKEMVATYENGGVGAEPELSISELAGCLRYLYQQAGTAKERGVKFLDLLALSVGSEFIGLDDMRPNKPNEKRSILFPGSERKGGLI
jgi:hypothetical protein